MKFSKITISLALLIIVSASFARKISELIRAIFGKEYFLWATHVLIFFFVIFLVILLLKSRFVLWKLIFFITFLILTGMIIWHIRLPEEKIHFLEYGILAWAASRDVFKQSTNKKKIFLAFGFCLAVGFIDEIFQGILPERFFDWRDILFNAMGSVWGIIFFLIRPVKSKRE